MNFLGFKQLRKFGRGACLVSVAFSEASYHIGVSKFGTAQKKTRLMVLGNATRRVGLYNLICLSYNRWCYYHENETVV